MTLGGDKDIGPYLPNYYGVKTIAGDKYLEIEALQSRYNPATSVSFEIKIGFQSYRPDDAGMELAKKMYYVKAMKLCEELITPYEHTQCLTTQARWLNMKDSRSSCTSVGFRVEGVRLRESVVPLDMTNKTLRVFEAYLNRAKVKKEMLEKTIEAIRVFRQKLAKSDTFMSHNLYGSSLILIMDDSVEKEPVLVKMTELGDLVNRGSRGVSHVVTEDQLPLHAHHNEDGYLTGLDNLIMFFENFTPSDEEF